MRAGTAAPQTVTSQAYFLAGVVSWVTYTTQKEQFNNQDEINQLTSTRPTANKAVIKAAMATITMNFTFIRFS